VTFPILGPSGHAIAALTTPYMRRIDEYVAPSLDDVTTTLERAAAKLSMHEEQHRADAREAASES
jgi:hypothetical protein